MDHEKSQKRFSKARISGATGHISMSDTHFTALNEQVPAEAHHRLMAAFSMFCTGQRKRILGSAYRTWIDESGASLAEFNAYGVIVSGRLARGRLYTFHVTDVKGPTEMPEPRSRVPDSRPAQPELELEVNPAQRGSWNE